MEASKNLFYLLDIRRDNLHGQKYLTFWRHQHKGYCFFKSWCALDHKPKHSSHKSVVYVNSYEIEDLWIPVRYEGKWRLVIENTRENRKRLKIE